MSNIYCQTIGAGDDIVLLHGWGLHSDIWQTLVQALQPYFRLHLIDLPGCGKSQSIEGLSIASLAELLLEKAPKQATWIGWSLGGLLSSFIAAHYPERVTQLVTVTSTPKFVAEQDWPGLSSHALEQFAQDLTLNYQQTLSRFFALQWHGIPSAKQWLKKLESFFIEDKPAMNALQQQLLILQQTDLREAWKKIQCPALHILGRLDAIVPGSLALKFKDLVPHHQTYVVSKAAHLPFLTHQDEFLQQLHLFLKTNL